ncbi:MAG TPA: OmpH family outer membrane protein [Patescibacteria group bacterium]|nr:OmpH family outer membrane protein [Patescibacteria group bacterium]
MKRVGICLCALIAGLVFCTAQAKAADKFAYVDLSRIFSEYAKTKDFDKALGDKQNAYTAERDKRVNELKQMEEKLNLLSDKEKEAKRPEFEAKVKDFDQFRRQKETDLRKEQDDRMREVLKDIEEAVKQIAQTDGYTMVFNDRVLVYQTKSMDISDKVIEILNKGTKK